MYKLHATTVALGLFLYAIYFFLVPDCGHLYDNQCWSEWAAFYLDKGFRHTYDSGTNYLPGHLYQLKFFSLFFDDKASLAAHIYQLKRITLLGDLSGALLLASCARTRFKQSALVACILLNPAFLHNTLIWGQFDSVFSAFLFGSFLALHRRKFLLSAVLYLLALNFKFQAILFFPAMLLLFLYATGFRIDRRKLLQGFGCLVVLELAILFPFILSRSLWRVWEVVDSLGGRFTYLSLNADNFWYLTLSGNLRYTGDDNRLLGLPFKSWGLLLAGVGLLAAFFPLLRVLYRRWKGSTEQIGLENAALVMALSVITFFFFSTQMHERYAFPAFLFIALVALQTNAWWLFGLFSLAYFLNNERALPHFLHETTAWINSPVLVASLYLTLWLLLMIRLWMPGKGRRSYYF
jgi:Gpi18-like mannosyltransferase